MSSSTHTRRTRSWSDALLRRAQSLTVFLAVTILLVINVRPAAAQDQRSGVTHLTGWPPAHERADLDHQVLPFIDTLFVSYTYGTVDDRPALSFAMEWLPEGDAVIRGERRRLSAFDVKMVAVELEADVYAGDRRAATISVVVDSMLVGPSPDFVEINLPDLAWSNVFMNTSEEEARALFAEGFELRNPEFMHVAFALFQEAGEPTGDASRPRIGRPQPRDVSVYGGRRTGFVFDLFWLVGGERHPLVTDRGTPRGTAGRGRVSDSPRSRAGRSEGAGTDITERTGRDRAERPGTDITESTGRDNPDGTGRNIAERSGERSGDADRNADRDGDSKADREGESKRGGLADLLKGDDNDDDDDDRLVPYALAAVGAAGVLAVAGGTVGYFGSAHQPYGLTSGLVRRHGGLLLQVAVNEALLSDADGPKQLLGRLLAVGNVLRGEIQPAVGAGVLATSRGSDVETEPSISVGAVAQLRSLVFYGGYDVMQQGLELSVALNIRRLLFDRSR